MTVTQTAINYAYPLIAGLILGFLYYGGLWMILRRLPQLKHPALWVGLSLFVRTLVLVVVLYLLFGKSWQQLLIAVAGILISRTLLVQYIRPRRGLTE